MLTSANLLCASATASSNTAHSHGGGLASFGDRVKEARSRQRGPLGKSWSQADLALAMGSARNTIDGWENRNVMPRPAVIEQLARVLNVSTGWLRGETDIPDRDVPEPRPVDRASVERPLPRVANSHAVRVWLKEFELELTRAGVPEERVNEAVDLCRSPQVFQYFAGGNVREFNEEEALKAMNAIAMVVRHDLRARGFKLDPTP